jgi:hypothetical protein
MKAPPGSGDRHHQGDRWADILSSLPLDPIRIAWDFPGERDIDEQASPSSPEERARTWGCSEREVRLFEELPTKFRTK